MVKKFLSAVLVTLLIISSWSMNVFASEANTQEEITSYDSLIVLDLQFAVPVTLYEGNRPLLTPKQITITSSITNVVDISLQARAESFQLLDSQNRLPPGQTITLTIPPTLPLETYTITITALNPNINTAPCAFTISEGNTGEDIEVVQLTTAGWSNVVTNPINLLLDEYVTVTNLVYSSGDVEIRVINQNTTMPYEDTKTLTPQSSDTWPVGAGLLSGGNYIVQARAVDTAGTYYLNVATSIIE